MLKQAFEGILFTLQEMDVKLPAPYLMKLAALVKEDELYQTLIDLEEAFKEPRGNKKR